MKRFTKKIKDIIKNNEKVPIPLSVIPNNMGINLVSVEEISWEELDDGQLKTLTIRFIPDEINKHKDINEQSELNNEWINVINQKPPMNVNVEFFGEGKKEIGFCGVHGWCIIKDGVEMYYDKPVYFWRELKNN